MFDYLSQEQGFGSMAHNPGKPRALSVSEAMALAKTSLEGITVKLIGEVSEFNCKPGYKAVYFTLKDKAASLPCMMWMNRYHAADVQVGVGTLVEVSGRFTLYAAKGRMNFEVFTMAIAGEGDLRLKVANLARKLQAEGLMEPSRKKPIPEYPGLIGVVTSPRGAAVHDVLRTLRRRYPLAVIALAGVPVEGANAAQGMIEALQVVEDAQAELVLLVRGGGSFEDLMPFNDESLARKISSMRIPVVTGIGHEPDTTIADLVSDLRCSTPTAAAEAVSPQLADMIGGYAAQVREAGGGLKRRLGHSANLLGRVSSRPVFKGPHLLYAAEQAHLEMQGSLIEHGSSHLVESQRAELALRAARLHDLSPLAVMGRGYSIARDEAGKPIRGIDGLRTGDRLSVQLHDGSLACRIEDIFPGDRLGG